MKTISTLCVLSSIVAGLILGSAQPSEKAGNPFSSDTIFQPRGISHPSFMSPHASPMVANGQHIFVVNTPADTVDLINIVSRKIVRRIHVGIDPVSIACRPDGKEVWVSNHVSDSVSVIDTDPSSPTYLHVVDTIQEFDRDTRATRFDEPVGIAFASNEKAYVALSSENEIAVIDVGGRAVTKRLKIKSQDPRHIVVRNGRLYVIPFESNNQTQLSGGSKDDIDGDLVTFDAWQHSIVHNNVLSVGHVVDIIKHPEVPDRDLFVFDVETDKLIESVDTLGTLLYGMAVGAEGDVFIAQTDARNDINGRAGTKKHGLKELENRPFLNRVTKVVFDDDGKASRDQVSFFDLDPQLPTQPTAEEALATPFAIEVSPDEATLFVTAAGSDKLVSLDADTGKVLGTANVGSVPRGVLLDGTDDDANLAWVFNAVGNSVSLIDVTDPAAPQQLQTIELEDPTPAKIKHGRQVFNAASASTTGTFSCASCHPDGHTDQLLWVLKTPIVTGGDQIMPRSTMPIRGLRETEPFHWDGIPGDPYGGNNSANVHRSVEPNVEPGSAEGAVRNVVDGSLASTMSLIGEEGQNDEGKAGLLSAAQRDDLAAFLVSVPYPPSQKRPYTNEPTDRARKGFELFHIKGDNDPSKHQPNVCGDCHRMPNWVSTNTPGTGMDAPTWRGAYDRWLILPQGRLNLVEFDFFQRIAKDGLDERRIWQLSWGGRPRFDPVWDMVVEGSTGFSGTFARQVTLNRGSAADEQSLDLLDALETAASEEAIVLQLEGALIDENSLESVSLQFSNHRGGHYCDRSQQFATSELIERAKNGTFVGTFTAHVGSGFDEQQQQPVIWTRGTLHEQSGQQKFPCVHDGNSTMEVSGRHVSPEAIVVVNGRRADGSVSVSSDSISISLQRLPPVGMHLLQLQNPDGLFSNDFIFHVAKDESSAVKLQNQLKASRKNAQQRFVDAVSANDLMKVKAMLKGGAKVNALAPESGATALCQAALYGHVEMAKLLVENGARVNRSNRDGNAPLHIAAFLCRFEIVDLLIENKADLTKKNRREEAPADVVAGNWNDGLARFYQSIADSSGFEIDLEQMESDRARMVKRLGK